MNAYQPYIKPAGIVAAVIACLLGGAITYGWVKGLIIHIPRSTYAAQEHIVEKKNVTLHWWNNNRWNSESINLISSHSSCTTITHVVNCWLINAQEVGIIIKKVTVQACMLSKNNNELFISFDRTILDKELSIYQKLQFINGLLKTIDGLNLGITHVRFLTHHQPLHDYHLDFTNAWNIHQCNL